MGTALTAKCLSRALRFQHTFPRLLSSSFLWKETGGLHVHSRLSPCNAWAISFAKKRNIANSDETFVASHVLTLAAFVTFVINNPFNPLMTCRSTPIYTRSNIYIRQPILIESKHVEIQDWLFVIQWTSYSSLQYYNKNQLFYWITGIHRAFPRPPIFSSPISRPKFWGTVAARNAAKRLAQWCSNGDSCREVKCSARPMWPKPQGSKDQLMWAPWMAP